MTPEAYALVVLSAITHASWNFLLKRSGGAQEFIGLSKVVEAVLLVPVLVRSVAIDPYRIIGVWWLPAVGAAFVLLNYLLLTAAYRRGDLSLVYPISRGAVLLFLPPIAFITIGERLDALGWTAIALIVVGIAFLQLESLAPAALRAWGRSLCAPATTFALLAAFVAAAYTVWDKEAVQVLEPLVYFAAYTLLVGAAYGLMMRPAARPAALARAWRTCWAAIVAVAVLNSCSYLLALAALRTGKASYVIALRQLSIAFGAALGWWLLGETIPVPRRAGIVLVLGGCVLLGLAR